jgi:chorismate-pyruvate lyase
MDLWTPVLPFNTLELASLTPLLRAFVVTDGTVTEFLEAYFLETIEIRKLSSLPKITQDCYEREVLLVGKTSKQCYVHARSTIWLERLSVELRSGLLDSDRGIGRLLREYRVETYRQLLSYWSEPAGQLAGSFALDEDDPLIGRTYDVYYQGQAIMRITERFPVALF